MMLDIDSDHVTCPCCAGVFEEDMVKACVLCGNVGIVYWWEANDWSAEQDARAALRRLKDGVGTVLDILVCGAC